MNSNSGTATGGALPDLDEGNLPVVGIDQVDAEHRDLVKHYRALVGAYHDGADATAFGLSFYSLLRHVRQHFEREESLMRDLSYPGHAEHAAEHERLLREAADLLSRVHSGIEKHECAGIAAYFRSWLVDHIEQQDQDLGEFSLRDVGEPSHD